MLNYNATVRKDELHVRPDLVRSALEHWRSTAAHSMCTVEAPALQQARAESSHLTRIVWWLKGSARRAPATAPALRAVSLCLCVRDVAVSGSSTWRVDRVSWSTMASTARMVPKPSSLGSHQPASIEFILYRRRRMDDCV